MAGKSASILVKILGDASKFAKSLTDAEGKLDSFSGKMQSTGAAMMKTGAAMTAGLTLPIAAFGVMSVKAFAEAEDAQAQLEASLKSTGATAWTSADQIDALAQSMQDKLGVDGDLIKSGASVLLTFTNVQNKVGEGNDIFDRATQAAADMSAKLGTDLPAANMQLGKALQDPVRGMAALRRAGVQLSAAQEQQVKDFVAVGDVVSAQKVLLAELERQFGGSAEAAGNTAAGGMEKLRLKFEDIQESIGERLVPVLEKLGGWLEKALDWWDSLGERGQTIVMVMAGVAAAIGPVVTVVGSLVTAIGFLVSPVGLVVAAIAALVAGLVYLYKNNEDFRAWVDSVAAVIRDRLVVAFEYLRDNVLPALADAFAYFRDEVLPALSDAFQAVADKVGPVLGAAFTWLTDTALPALEEAFAWFEEHAGPVLSAFGELVAAVAPRVADFMQMVADDFIAAANAIQAAMEFLWPVIEVVWGYIVDSISAAMRIIQGVIQVVTALIKGDWSGVWEGIKQIVSGVWAGIVALVSGALGVLRVIVSGALSAIGGVFSGAWNGIRSATSGAFNAVVGVIAGAMNAARSTVSSILSAIGGLFRGVVGTVSGALSGLANAVSGPFRAAGNAIKQAWNSTIGGKGITIPDIPGLPGRGQSYSIPRLHTGGVFQAAGGAGEGLALLKTGETVRTREQEAALSRSAPSAPVTVNVNFSGPVANDAVGWVIDAVEQGVAKGMQLPKLRRSLVG